VDRDQALAAARQVGDVAGRCADESEQLRRLAPALATAIRESGLSRLIAPTALGGCAIPPSTMAEVVEIVSHRDASAGWCVGIGSGSNYLAGLVARSAAEELFTDLDRPGVGPFEPLGRAIRHGDGFLLNGRWRFASNCHQGGVMAAGVFRFDGDELIDRAGDGSPIPQLAFLTNAEYHIVETWDTVGMRGTGSHDTVATDVRITGDRIAMLFDKTWPDDPLYRLRPFDVLGACLSAVPLGIGRAALDLVIAKVGEESAAGEAKPGPRAAFSIDAIAQAAYGRAEVRLRAARALLHEALGELYAHALRGDRPPREATALVGLANGEALEAGVEAVDTAARLLGSAAVREGAPIERLRRDIDTVRQHVLFSASLAAPLSRQLAGLLTIRPPYLPPLGRP
jgi:alkylation response protein AidB-like acyl-CoA dehydrogenase